MLDTHLQLPHRPRGTSQLPVLGFRFLESLKCVHTCCLLSCSKVIWSSEYFPQMSGVVMLQASFLLK